MNKKSITSIQNPRLKVIRELIQKKATRKKHQQFVVEGIRAVQEIPKETPIDYVVVSEEVGEEQYKGLQTKEVIVVPADLFKSLGDTQTPQGMLAVVSMPETTLEEALASKGPYLVLENLQDPGNLGTIIRTAHAFGFQGVLLTKGCVDLYSPKVVRSTMSSLFYVPVVTDLLVEDIVAALKAHQVTLYTTALTEDAKSVCEVVFASEVALVIGNEGNGVSEALLAHSDVNMIIPMPGGAESLNASMAAGVCMYEVLRQKS